MNGTERVVFDVPDISCVHCKMAIEDAVTKLDGVESVRVDVAARNVDVVFDGASIDRQRIASAIEEQGYTIARARPGDG